MAKAPTDEFGTPFGDSSTPATLTKAEIDAAVAAEVARAEASQTNEAARRSTEAWASPFSTAFGGTAASTTLDAVREYASPFSTVFGGGAPATPYTPSQFVNPTVPSGTYTGSAAAPVAPISSPSTDALNAAKTTTTVVAPKNTVTTTPTTAKDILRQALLETGMPADVAEASLTFVQSLIDDGITQADAIHHLYNFKDFTTKAGSKLTSPFYAKYTSLGEGLTGAERKTPLELMQFTLTTEKLVKNYGFSDKFASYDSLKKYVQNNVSATDLEPRMQAAVLKTTEADPTYVAALQKLGYISGAQDLADFFLDPNIGQQQLEVNRTAAAFAQANLQRSGAGLTLDPTQIKRISAQYVGMGDTKALATAAQGYETIGQTLAPEYQLATMYEQPRGTILTKEQQVELQKSMQAQLENEQFMGMGLASQERKKRLTEQAVNAFQAQSGTYGGRSTSYSRQSTAGMI